MLQSLTCQRCPGEGKVGRTGLEWMLVLLWGRSEEMMSPGYRGQRGPGPKTWSYSDFPVLSLQPGHGTGSWALRTLVNTTWRSQMPNSPTMLPMSARPQRLHCARGGPNSPCSVMTPNLLLPSPLPSSTSPPFPLFLTSPFPLLSLPSLVLSQQLLTKTSSKTKGLER